MSTNMIPILWLCWLLVSTAVVNATEGDVANTDAANADYDATEAHIQFITGDLELEDSPENGYQFLPTYAIWSKAATNRFLASKNYKLDERRIMTPCAVYLVDGVKMNLVSFLAFPKNIYVKCISDNTDYKLYIPKED